MAGAYGRNDGSSNVQSLYKQITFADGQSAVITVGRLPANAIIMGAGLIVTTAFNDATNKLVQLGTSGDDDGLGTNLSVATIGDIVWDELATSDDLYSTSEVTIICTHARTGTAATAGAAWVYVNYIVVTN